MSHAYSQIFLHVVFATDGRFRHKLERMERAHSYLGGIARANDFTAIAVGGVEDHVHALLILPASLAVSQAMKVLKGASSKWFNEEYPDSHFRWQEGFAAFSVSPSQVDSVVRYIKAQSTHHARRDFREEYRLLLEKHGVKLEHELTQD
jgi:REP element-mobilizing transposase RayT